MYVSITELSKNGHISRQTIYNNLTKLEELNLTKRTSNGKILIDTEAIDILTRNRQTPIDKVVEVKSEEVHEEPKAIQTQSNDLNMQLLNEYIKTQDFLKQRIEDLEQRNQELQEQLVKQNSDLYEKMTAVFDYVKQPKLQQGDDFKNNIDVTEDTEPQQKQGFWKRLFMK